MPKTDPGPRNGRPAGKGHVILIGNDKMGSGPDELGSILIKGFLSAVKETVPLPAAMVFYNQGIQLAVEGSPVLNTLNELEALGITMLVCGTCLNYFDKKESLRAGRVSNMYEITETLTGASHIISP
jgi:selenium metabolism protein YedF